MMIIKIILGYVLNPANLLKLLSNKLFLVAGLVVIFFTFYNGSDKLEIEKIKNERLTILLKQLTEKLEENNALINQYEEKARSLESMNIKAFQDLQSKLNELYKNNQCLKVELSKELLDEIKISLNK